jgi:hypothetical protein
MTVTVTLTFGSADEAALFLAGHRAPVEVKMPQAEPAKPKKEAAQVEKSTPAATATAAATSTATPTSAPASVASEGPTYNEVKAAVLALAKVDQALAMSTLAKFTGQNGEPCNHGTKLKLEDYPKFIAAANEALKVSA